MFPGSRLAYLGEGRVGADRVQLYDWKRALRLHTLMLGHDGVRAALGLLRVGGSVRWVVPISAALAADVVQRSTWRWAGLEGCWEGLAFPGPSAVYSREAVLRALIRSRQYSQARDPQERVTDAESFLENDLMVSNLEGYHSPVFT